MDRGFEMMIPKSKEDAKPEYDYNYSIKFSLFNREFDLSFRVNKKQER